MAGTEANDDARQNDAGAETSEQPESGAQEDGNSSELAPVEPTTDATNAAGDDADAKAKADAEAAWNALVADLTPVIQTEVQKAVHTLAADLVRKVEEIEARIEASAPAEILRIANEAKAEVASLTAKLRHMI